MFPDLSDIEVYEKILAIKASNRGSLAGLTGRKVVDIISAEISGGGVDSDEDGGSSTASGDSLGQVREGERITLMTSGYVWPFQVQLQTFFHLIGFQVQTNFLVPTNKVLEAKFPLWHIEPSFLDQQ